MVGPLSNDGEDGSENDAKKNEFASFQTLSRLFGPTQFVKCGQFLLDLNSSGLYATSKRERKIRPRMFTSSIKRRIRRFYVVVVQWTSKKCTKKRVVLLIKPIGFDVDAVVEVS